MLPEKKQLKKLLETKSLIKIAVLYNKQPETIRRWIKTLNLWDVYIENRKKVAETIKLKNI